MILPAPKRPGWLRLPERDALRRPLLWIVLLALITVLVGVSFVARLALELTSPDTPRLGGNVGDGSQADYTLWPFGALIAPINPDFIEAAESDNQAPPPPSGNISPVPTAVIAAPTATPTATPPLVNAEPSATATTSPAAPEPAPATATATATATSAPVRAPTQPPSATSTRVPPTSTPAAATATPVTRPDDLQPTARPSSTPASPTATTTRVPPTNTPQPTSTPRPPTSTPAPVGTPTSTPPPATPTEPPRPTLAFADESLTINEDQGQILIEVRLSAAYLRPVTVNYRTEGGSATAGADYTATSGTLTFNPGDVTKTFTVALNSDGRNEPNETVNLVLSDLTNATLGPGASEVAVLTITDNDAPPTVRFAGTTRTVAESGESTAFTVELSELSDLAVAVPYSVGGTATLGNVALRVGDHNLRNGVVIIPAGTASSRVRFTIVDDRVDEDDESVLISLGTPINADLASPSVYVVTITDNDRAGVNLGQTSFNLVEGASATYTVTLNSEPTQPVRLTLNPDAQMRTDRSELTFTPLNWSQPQTVTLTAHDDFVDEGTTHPGSVSHVADSADPRYNRIAVSPVGVTITDNDTAGVQVTATSPLPVSESPSAANHAATYTIVLKSEPTAPVTITLAPDTQVTVSPTRLVFDATNWRTPQTVTVTAVDDAYDEAAAHPSLITHSVASADPFYAGLIPPEQPADVNVSVTDDDTAGVTIGGGILALSEGAPGPNAGTYTVTLTSRPTTTVTISLAVTDTQQLSFAPATLVFGNDDASWRTPQTVTVTATQDLIDEGSDSIPHTRQISHTLASADPNYGALAAPAKTVAITDDDTAGIEIIAATSSLTESASLSYTVRLRSQPTGAVVLTLANDPVGQVNLASASLSFSATNWMTPTVVTVTGVDNPVIEGDRPVTITHTIDSAATGDPIYDALGDTALSVTVRDDDVAGLSFTNPVSITEGLSDVYSVSLTSQPTADVTVTLSITPSLQVDQPFIVFTPINWSSPQPILVTATDDLIFTGDRPAPISHSLSSADPNFNGAGPFSYSVTVLDDDNAGLLVAPSALFVSETAGFDSGSFAVSLSSEPTAPVTITLTPDAQQLVSPSELVFTAANYTQTQTVTVTVVDDAIAETTPHTGTIGLSSDSADPGYQGKVWPAYTLGIDDNDVAAVSVSAPTSLTTSEGGSKLTFLVWLTSQPRAPVTISVTSSDPTEAQVSVDAPRTLPLVFDASNWTQPVTVTVQGLDDVDYDGRQPFTVEIGPAASSDTGYGGLAPALPSILLSNIDDEPALVSVGDAPTQRDSGSAVARFPVTLRRAPLVTTTVSFTTYDLTATAGEDYAATGGVITFTEGVTTAFIDVPIYADSTYEDDELFGVRITGATAPGDLTGLDDVDGLGRIQNDDIAGLHFEQRETVLREGSGPATLVVRLDRARPTPVTVEYSTVAPGPDAGTATAGDDYIAQSGTLTFSPGQITQTISLTILDDSAAEELYETVRLTLFNATGAPTTIPSGATITIVDDETPPPPATELFMVTGGPATPPERGHYYTGGANGFGSLLFSVPCSWPTGRPVTFELWSPAIHSSAGSKDLAGADGSAGDTEFELYELGPGGDTTSLTPAPGASAAGPTTFSTSGLGEGWEVFRTISDPTPCSQYLLRFAASGDDINYWAARAGFATDADPATPLDGSVAGSAERLTMASLRATVEHQAANTATTSWFYVAPGTASLRLGSFDLDSGSAGSPPDPGASVRYYAPGGVYDPTGAVGGIAGTPSTNGWSDNIVSAPRPGWWRAVVFTSTAENAYILEAEGDGALLPLQYEAPTEPALSLSVTPAAGTALPGQQLGITLAYTSSGQAAVYSTTLTVRLPGDLAFDGDPCGGLATGCSWSADGTLILELAPLTPGAIGAYSFNVAVAADGKGAAPISLGATFRDSAGNIFRAGTGTVVAIP